MYLPLSLCFIDRISYYLTARKNPSNADYVFLFPPSICIELCNKYIKDRWIFAINPHILTIFLPAFYQQHCVSYIQICIISDKICQKFCRISNSRQTCPSRNLSHVSHLLQSWRTSCFKIQRSFADREWFTYRSIDHTWQNSSRDCTSDWERAGDGNQSGRIANNKADHCRDSRTFTWCYFWRCSWINSRLRSRYTASVFRLTNADGKKRGQVCPSTSPPRFP